MSALTIERDFKRPERSQRVAREHLAGLGGVRLASGLLVFGSIIAIGQFIRFLLRLPYYPDTGPPLLAWLLLLGSFIAGVIWVSARGGLLTVPMLVTLAIPALVAVWIDLSSATGLLPVGVIPSATMALGSLMMPLAALRRPSTLIASSGFVAGTLIVWTAAQMTDIGLWALTPWVLVFWGVYPSILAILIVVLFRRMVRTHVDLALIQSTTDMSPRSLGMIESERITELDGAAEKLLSEVGAGAEIDQAIARRAGDLAGELRRALIDGRRESWLDHAIRESEFLRGAIELDDADGLVALCDARRRDALLAALWMLAAENRPGSARIHVRVRPVSSGRHLEIRIVLQQSSKRRISPTMWNTLELLGPRSVRARNRTLDIRVTCPIRSRIAATG